jgi:hypothetical protein
MKKLETVKLGRRRFLAGAGGAMLALPFLPSLAETVRAESRQFPRRFIAIFSANGQHDANWYPTQPLPFVQTAPNIREIPLTSIPGPISAVIGKEFDRFRKKMLLVRGLDAAVLHENTHIATKMLSGYGEGAPLRVTIDQIMARSPNVYAQEPWMRSLNVVADGQSEMKYLPLSVARTGKIISPVVPYTDPAVVFQKLFPTPIDHDVRKSVLDAVTAETQALFNSPRLSDDDRQRLDAHLSFLRDVEKQSMPANACARPGIKTIDSAEEKSAADVIRNYASLMTASIKCDLCRVYGFQLNHTQEQRSFAWLTGVTGTNHHNLTHDAGTIAPLAKINQWYAALVAEVLRQLDVVEDPVTGATYLDNSLVFWGNESGVYDLNFGNPHFSNDMQVMLIGGRGLIRTNRFINYQTPGKKIIMFQDGRADLHGPDLGRPYNQLLVTLMTKMGLTPDEWELDGEQGFGDYRVNFKGQYNFNNRRVTLARL